jgi:hypothetical protein
VGGYSVNLTLKNGGTSALDLKTVTIYYYFSKDGATTTVSKYYSPVDGTSVAQTAVTGSASADAAYTVSFAQCATGCSLGAGANTGAIQGGITVNPPSGGPYSFNATNDYSYTPTGADPCSKVVVMQGSSVLFGTAP